MALKDVFEAAGNSELQGRCQAAMWKAAQDIMAEADNTADHIARKSWALNVLRDATNITPRQLVMQVLRNATIAQSPLVATDGDLQFQVNSVIATLVEIG